MTTIIDAWRGYSVAERDRRWNGVRAGAAAAGIDCIFVPLGAGLDARYLTQLKGAVQSSCIVLPTDGSDPVVISEYGSNDWVPAPKKVGRAWSEPMAQMLLDAGMERARIGVVGLNGGIFSHVRSPDGAVNETSFAHVMARLPNATFVDATDVVGRVRFVKGPEEIECLRRGAEIAEAGIQAMVNAIEPGVDGAAPFAAAMEKMLEMGSEYYPLAMYVQPIAGPQGARRTNPPFGVKLESGSLITTEVGAVWGHEVAQEDQPILVGRTPDPWKPVIEVQHDVFNAGLELMKPGTTFRELNDHVNSFGAKRGLTTMTLMHGRGYGDDGPLIIRGSLPPTVGDVRLEAGNVFIWKPIAQNAAGSIEFTWGGDVVVTESGGKPLFKRRHGMVEVPA